MPYLRRARPNAAALLLIASLLLLIAPVRARAQSEYERAPSETRALEGSGALNERALGEALLAAATQTERAGSLERASALYASAAERLPASWRDVINLRAAELLTLHAAPLDERARRDALALAPLKTLMPQFADRQLRLTLLLSPHEELPDAALLDAALEADAAASCEALEATYPIADAKKMRPSDALDALFDALHGFCEPDEESRSSLDAAERSISDRARVRRAATLLGRVHFNATLQELERIRDRDALDEATRCHADFMRARATYRIKKTRQRAEALYAEVAKACTSPASSVFRRRSLYAMGKRAFDTGDLKETKRHFTTILNDYAETSYGDDALMYLARVARAEGDFESERELMRRALKEYPSGDLTFEIVWETLEPLVRAQRDQDYLDALGALKLPERDDQYFSQGRLDYFAARALARLGQEEAARERDIALWRAYPFSFYGYLGWVRAVEGGSDPQEIALEREGESLREAWFLTETWGEQLPGALARHGLYDWAARLEAAAAPSTPEALWRLAWLHHRANAYPISHNIARRRIEGRPWVEPERGRALRWQIAWPAPYLDPVIASIAEERAERDASVALQAAFPLSIMREESSFIPDIVSYAGALGLMQLMLPTARDHDGNLSERPVTREQLRTAEINIRVGVDHLFTLADRMDNHPVLMAASYNAGAGAVRRWLKAPQSAEIALWVEDVPYLQARDYSKRVIGSYIAYQWMLGADTFDLRVGAPAMIK